MLHAAFSYFAGRNAGTAVGTDLSYGPLLAGMKEIRLLEPEAAGSCQLRYTPLDSAPVYFALSHACRGVLYRGWQEDSDFEIIICRTRAHIYFL